MTNKSIISSAALVCIAFWSAYSLDSFATMILILPGLLFFLTIVIHVIIKAIKKRRMNELKSIFVALVGFVLLISAFKLSNHGLTQLTKERERAMKELRPVFLKYRQEKGTYPDRLELLIPNYISKIPVVLRATGQEDPYQRIMYVLENGKPVFRYRVVRGPDSGATFDIESGTIAQDM